MIFFTKLFRKWPVRRLKIHSTRGTIGGIVIQENSLRSANGSYSLSSDGVLNATNANISGNINALSGSVGGFTLDQGSMRAAATSGPGGITGQFVLNPAAGIIAFSNAATGTFAGIGPSVIDVSTGARALARFNNVEQSSAGINIGMMTSASGAPTNIALDIPSGGIRIGGQMGVSGRFGYDGGGRTHHFIFSNGLLIEAGDGY